MSTKEAIIAMIQNMPAGATWAEIVAEGTARFGTVEDESLTPEEWETAWAEEINRRVADVEAGRVKLIPAEEVMARLREKYG
ncbi:MAG: hypothetical protein JWO38_7701 [Gemmataceae bacterium]|nr:hypothetical protein [Gemmataceae bacterium]